MIHIRNIEVYAPAKMGRKDILIANQKIVGIFELNSIFSGMELEVIDGSKLIVLPGLIDSHVHIAGAGGEGGPSTRTPEVRLSQLIEGGITTVIGCLGTDGLARSLDSVLMKVKALRAEGISAWMYTGSYQVPTPTFFGDVGKDISLIEEIIGTGEIAISDHRSSCPSVAELTRLASHTRVGGMLGGKAGIVNVHMGDAKDPFRPLHQVVENSELNYNVFLPTHLNRNFDIFEEAKVYGKKGYVDLTTSSYPFFPDEEVKSSTGVIEWLKAGVPIEHITMSSDACGSLPTFDENGELTRLESGAPVSLFIEFRDAVKEGLEIEKAIKTVTSNVARILKLKNKGRLAKGLDADLLICNQNLEIEYVMAMGEWCMYQKQMIKKGTYEK